MSDPHSPLDYVVSAVEDAAPIGFKTSCRLEGGKIWIRLSKGDHHHEFTMPEDLQEIDSDGITDALRMPMEQARRAVLKLEELAKPKKRKKSKGKKRKKARPYVSISPVVESTNTTPLTLNTEKPDA